MFAADYPRENLKSRPNRRWNSRDPRIKYDVGAGQISQLLKFQRYIQLHLYPGIRILILMLNEIESLNIVAVMIFKLTNLYLNVLIICLNRQHIACMAHNTIMFV